jgi:hypothetical protein
VSETPRDKTEAHLYNGLVSFNQTAQWDILRLPQMRQYLAEHLTNALVPSWLHERKAETAGEEIAHVLLMVGLFPPDWLEAHRAEVLAEDGQAYDGELAMLRGLVRTLRAVVRDDRADVAQKEVRRLLYEHTADERAAYEEGKSSRPADATPDTFPAWLAQRFDPNSPPWDALDHDGRTYWQHEATAVRRAVARGGFKNDATQGDSK